MTAYQGLVNQGATCYLNSLLQTLYMTYEFRTNVYAYLHDPKKIAEKDSIPYQLQKLFVNLQTKDKPCFTKDLLKSFQWNDFDSFQQHDVQQFCRVLFEAIEKTHKNTVWIKQLFGGVMNSYIDCGQHRSLRSEMYLDMSLPIRNQYTLQLYKSVQDCLKAYLRPETIEGVQCSQCGQKKCMQKGLSLQSAPLIFSIQLNRFELNYETFQRQKINSFLYYPEILQLHRFFKPFNQIEVKGLPVNLQIKSVTVAKEKSLRSDDVFGLQTTKTRERKKSDDLTVKKQTVTFFDEQNRNKRVKKTKQLSAQQQKQKHLQIVDELKKEQINRTMLKQLQAAKNETKIKDTYDLENDMLFGTVGGAIQSKDWTSGSFEKATFQKTEVKYEHEEDGFDPLKEYPNFTYALYAVLVHSGGSQGGHYYAYISDGHDWYRFDDQTVKKVSRYQIRKYGANTSSTIGTNAYMLFYRDVKSFKELNKIEIPHELFQKVKIQQQKVVQTNRGLTMQRAKRIQQITEALIIKIYKDSTSEPTIIVIQNKSEKNMGDLREKIKSQFNINQKDQNWRVRRYNKSDDSMHEVYGVEMVGSLKDLGFRQTIYVIVEYKTDNQIFEQYNPKKITVKINIWRPDVFMIMQKKLKPIKIQILDEQPFQSLYVAVVKASNIKNPLIIKRNYSGNNPITKLDLQSNKNKKLIDLRFFNNITLYVQEQLPNGQVKWAQQFQNERYRCVIKFNNPKIGQNKEEEIYFDTRKTLGDLKKYLSEIINISQDNFRVKRGKQALAEMTTYKKKLTDLRFVGTEMLYLEQGKSSKGSIIVHRGQLSIVDDRIEFNIFEQMQFQIGSDLNTVSDLCYKISEQSGLPVENIRVRQYRSYEFKQIYSRADLIQRIREKSLIWEMIEAEQQKGLQIYYRVFNIMTFQFGPLRQIYADSSSSYEELALLIQEDSGITHNKILVWKPLSNYIEKENMLDVEWKEIRYLNTTIRDEPLLIGCDGDILIIKEAEKAYIAPKYQKISTGGKVKEKGQAQLKITVIAETEDVVVVAPVEAIVEASSELSLDPSV